MSLNRRALIASATALSATVLGATFALAESGKPADDLKPRSRLILLGTGGGPTPKPNRSAPAQVIVVNGSSYVIDCGGGVARQLVLAGVPAAALPNDWLGYAVMARPAGQGVQRIVIVPPGGTAPRGDGFDWAVLITAPPRRLLVVPRAALRDGGDLTRFESNFMLSEA